jgi:hypothetical protein
LLRIFVPVFDNPKSLLKILLCENPAKEFPLSIIPNKHFAKQENWKVASHRLCELLNRDQAFLLYKDIDLYNELLKVENKELNKILVKVAL